MTTPSLPYRGRIAPSPTGFLHLGHAATFRIARQRADAAGGKLVLRVEDIDRERCREEFREAIQEDLRWFGLTWEEGPDCGGPFGPYIQSQRWEFHREIREKLRLGGFLYPCRCSRREVLTALGAPHEGDEEPLYPGTCRPKAEARPALSLAVEPEPENDGAGGESKATAAHHWRFRVPQGERLSFIDGALGLQTAVAGVDFGDFVVWRRDGIPAYQLAVVADDRAMRITEVVRGADLLLSTFRQLLLYRALGWEAPAFFHTPLVTDPATGQRLAKRHASLSLRELRRKGVRPESLTPLLDYKLDYKPT